MESMVSESFRGFLKTRLESIQIQNPLYSLRSYADELGVSPGSLSSLLNGNRPFTRKMMERICDRLELTEEERQDLFNRHKSTLKQKQLDQALFDSLSDVTYDMFLELCQLNDFEYDIAWISKRLAISSEKTQKIINDLQALGLIEVNGNEIGVKNKNTVVEADCNTSEALKLLQMQANALSRQSLSKDPLNQRYHGTNILAIDPAKMNEAKEYIREFRRRFCTDLNEHYFGSQIYQLNMSFYRIDCDGVLQ